MTNNALAALGWSDFFERQRAQGDFDGLIFARVWQEHRGEYRVLSETGDTRAAIPGKFRHEAKGRNDYPAVGDWVACEPRTSSDPLVIRTLLERKSKFSRRAAGTHDIEQIVAANIDWVFVLTSMNRDFNARRLERYLTLSHESGAAPVIVLTKTDLASDEERSRVMAELKAVAGTTPYLTLSLVSGEGIDDIRDYLQPGVTGALLGSSGVGKSSLVNALSTATRMEIGPVGEDDRGRHTTTHRELIVLAEGGILIDTPGMRELQLWGGAEGLLEAYADVEPVATSCRFTNCRHETEPGCAVQAALESGTLPPERWSGYLKLKGELKHELIKTDKAARSAETKKWRTTHKALRSRIKAKRGDDV